MKVIFRYDDNTQTELTLKKVGNSYKHESSELFFEYKVEEVDDIFKHIVTYEAKYESCRFSKLPNYTDTFSIYLDVQDKDFLAMYHFNEFWTRPKHGNAMTEIPKDTTQLVLRNKQEHEIYYPLLTKFTNTYLRGHKEGIEIYIHPNKSGLCTFNSVVMLQYKCRDFNEGLKKITGVLNDITNIIPIESKVENNFTDYLGWCTWDAFYKEISEDKVKTKIKEFVDNNIPIKWMILDDGWFNEKDEILLDFNENKNKFQSGLKETTKWIKSNSSIEYIGVWHALGGYWGGINKNNHEFNGLYEITSKGQAIPNEKFFDEWYSKLKSKGINMLKVDGQGALKSYFKHDEYITQSARMNKYIDTKSLKYFNGNIINCMGVTQENIFNRVSSISRNSDDFVPEKENSFYEHLLQNAYNIPWHGEFYNLDFDMFFTKHVDNYKHLYLRLISNGPVYISDRIGETDKNILNKVCDKDGKVLKFNNVAKMHEKSIYNKDLIHLYNNKDKNTTHFIFSTKTTTMEFNNEAILYDVTYEKFLKDSTITLKENEVRYIIEYSKNSPIYGCSDKINMNLTFEKLYENTYIAQVSGEFMYNDDFEILSEHDKNDNKVVLKKGDVIKFE